MIRRDRSIARAFTLVEMLAAMLLSTLLVLAILAVFPAIGRTRAHVAASNRTGRTLDQVFELVRWDLSQARRVKLQADQLTISGFGSLDPQTLEPAHRPARVVYRLQLRGGESWLVREQTDLDSRSNRNVDTLPVEHLNSIRFVARRKAQPASAPATQASPPIFGTNDGGPPPDAVDVFLQPAEPGAAAAIKTLYLR